MITIITERNGQRFTQMIQESTVKEIIKDFTDAGYTIIDQHETTQEELQPVVEEIKKPLKPKFDATSCFKVRYN